MQFFKKYFKLEGETPSDQGEYTVLCPFDHRDMNGNPYKESHASAHINEENSLFHCKSCGEGISEISFIGKVEGISYKEAITFLKLLEESDNSDWSDKVNNLKANAGLVQKIKDMGIISQVSILQLGYSGAGIDFPVFVYGELLDVRNYLPERTPKVLSRAKAKNLILPYDLWREDARPTILCAGEKDMAITRAMGFNAINFTGGEMSFPKLFKHSFKGKDVYIAYDNDPTGIEGALKVAYHLKEAGANPRIVTGHHEVCVEKGGDMHDYFVKYGKTADDFRQIMALSSDVLPEQIEKVKNLEYPMIPVGAASGGQFADHRFVRSQVNVVSIFEDMFSVPDYVRFTKYADEEGSIYPKGHTWEWVLDDDNIQDILHLLDSNITESKRNAALKRLARVPKDEEFVSISILSKVDIWKSVVTDVLGALSDSMKGSELLIYSLGDRFAAGKKYEMTYKPISHPYDGMRLVGISKEIRDIDTDIQNFKVTEDLKTALKVFQLSYGESVDDKMEELFERSKGFIGVEARREVTWATDLYYHTPLEFKIGKRVERAYLDTMIVGDPRTMKSATAKAMHGMYELGTITSLKTATIAGLLGGSDNVGGKGWKTKIGLLPQSHRGAIIMEEFSDTGKEIASSLTEVRSSNRVRITRVNGMTDVPAMVRMLSISNPAKGTGGMNRALANYSSGVRVILDLIGASEDIARYDFFLLVDEPKGYISPLDMFDLEPYEKEAYKARIRWIWSRTKEQVELDRPVAEYVVKQAEALNADFDSHIKLFGAEAWKKVARIAIATAGMVVSTDDDFERIVVKNEHVDFAVSFLRRIYDNDLFKLREYVENERSHSVCRPEDIHTLQKIYDKHAAMLEEMAISTEMTQRQLQLVSGLDMRDFPKVVNELGASKFIQWQGERILPTGKFRQAITKMNKSIYMTKGSER